MDDASSSGPQVERPMLPPRLETRRIEDVDRMLRAKAIAVIIGNAQKIAAYAPGALGSGASVINYGEVAAVDAGQSASANVLFDSFWCFELSKAAGAAGRMQHLAGLAPAFHHLVDPSTPIVPVSIVFEDYVAAVISALVAETVFGFHDHITLGDKTTLVGVGFRAGSDHIWHAFVNDCPTDVAPVTVRRDTTLAPLSTSFHRLTMVIDGRTKSITWLIDGVIVDSWIPGAALDQMRPTAPKVMWSMTCHLNAAGALRIHAGGLPQLRILNLANPTTSSG